MNIIIVAENAVLPAISYGGLQRVVWSLGRALCRLGHKVYFLCKSCADIDFATVIIRNPALPVVKQIPADVDIVHFHSPVPPNFPLPYVETIHGNFNKNISRNAIFVSQNHASRFGSGSYVYNGLDWPLDGYGHHSLGCKRSDYHFLAKAAWKVKNVRGAISLIKSMPQDIRLHVLGGNRFNFHMGWRFTFSRRIIFHGMCDAKQKSDLLTRSKGMVFPVVWHEPFGLAVIESLYFGCPVFATPYGAMPEIVAPEVGFLTASQSEMAYRMLHADFAPQRCYEYVRDTFSADRMAHEYLCKYNTVLNGGFLNDAAPADLGTAPKCVWTK